MNAELANTTVKTKDGEITYADRIRKMIGDRMYRMNYLAEFVDDDFEKLRETYLIGKEFQRRKEELRKHEKTEN